MKEKKPFIKKFIIFLLILITIVSSTLLYSRYIGTSGIFINEYKVVNKNLSNDFYGLKIVHISDLHYGRTINKKELNELVKQINLTKPDIVVLTGDLIDKDTNLTDKDIKIISDAFNKIDVTIGKYAIKGNHDYKFKKWDILIENSGFVNLNDKYELIFANENDYILLSGMSTNIYGDLKVNDKSKIFEEYINSSEIKPNYSILLMHEPDFVDNFDYNNFNLILAGHSHNGQVRLPIIGAIIKPNYGKKYYDHYYKLKNTDLYVSSGLGVSEVNFRLFNRPTFNLYRLTNK
mgnify:FL=1